MRIARAAASSRRNFSLKNFHQRVTTAALAFSQQRERSRTCTVVVLLQLVWLFSLSSLQAQDRTTDPPSNQSTEEAESVWKKLGLPEPNPNAPYANPPKLELLFDDDFATDSRSNYTIEGQDNSVGWEPGKLILSDGSKITRELQAENWVELELDLKFPELLQDGQKSELKVLLDLEPANDSYLLFRQKRLNGLTTSEISVYGSLPEIPIPIRAGSRSLPSAIPPGRIKITYYGGVWAVVMPNDDEAFLTHIPLGHAKITNCSLRGNGQQIEFRKYLANGASPVVINFSDERENELSQASNLTLQAFDLSNAGKLTDAIKLSIESLRIRHRLLGYYHQDVATSIHNLAAALKKSNQMGPVEGLIRELNSVVTSIFPGDHPFVAMSLVDLASVNQSIGRLDVAEEQFLNAANMSGRLAHDDPFFLKCVIGLANVKRQLGRSAEAEHVLEIAIEKITFALPDDHPWRWQVLNELAGLRRELGRVPEAVDLYIEALNAARRNNRENQRDIAVILCNLGSAQLDLGRLGEARANLDESQLILTRLNPNGAPEIALILQNIALLDHKMGKSSDADAMFSESLRLLRLQHPTDHPNLIKALNNIAGAKAVDKAILLYEESMSMASRIYPVEHPIFVQIKHDLAQCYQSIGNLSQANCHSREAVRLAIQLIDRDSCYLSEEQQMIQANALRWSLDSHIDLAIEYPLAVPFIRSSSWRLKGAVSLRQQQARRAFRSENSTIQLLASKLKDTARQYSMLANAMPEDPTQRDTWLEQLTKLNAERTRFERELSSISSEYQNANDDLQASPENVLAKLPENCVVVDFFRQSTGNPPKYVAIVSHSTLPPVLVPLGIAEEIELLVEQGRSMDWETATNLDGDESAPLQLRRIIWDRVAEHFGNCTTVLISPDGLLSMVPWSALPGNKPGTYLIEEFSVGILPTPQLLARMLREPSFDPGKVEDPASLLVVGDIDYGADPGASSLPAKMRSAPRIGTEGVDVRKWSELPNAGPEISVIRDLFGDRFPNSKVTRLRRGEATEDRFRTEAEQHSVLHLVTHGYFAPEQLKSIFQLAGNRVDGAVFASDSTRTIGYPPGILSGLVLTGANRVPEIGRDDGILTAIEAQELDLRHVKLVILSACETGLGPVAGAEGLLGMQRSFQLAGAETVVASLWKVPDAETQLLMQEFHRNLWDRKLGKLEALRQAQLAILNSHRQRGGTDEMDSTPSSLPPKFWAAWLLSGDWR